jgi:hypothetical protein
VGAPPCRVSRLIFEGESETLQLEPDGYIHILRTHDIALQTGADINRNL